MSTLNAHLKELVAELSAELPEVTERRMFGSDAFFANSNIYSIVWDGRILLRFPVEARFLAAEGLEGSGMFDPMGTGKTMRGWVAMPETMIDDVEALQPWLEEAHRMAMSQPVKKKGKPSPRPSPPRGRGSASAASVPKKKTKKA
ncbi:MAG: TfoX/Sxy family protein [Archangium sp.]|nr:TfoX/Sxy family protein [Archangium sp.]MDP3152844.1 TfoX/Sxy family protein [Archangium sp.]MDP3576089.1 TfoX/Sxy family protein [Archangium sp.]